MGAVDLVQKPTALATQQLYDLSDELVAKVVAAAAAHPRTPMTEPAVIQPTPPAGAVRLVVIGTSTGGPVGAHPAAGCAFPADFPAAVAVALHIPAGYTEIAGAPARRNLRDAGVRGFRGGRDCPGDHRSRARRSPPPDQHHGATTHRTGRFHPTHGAVLPVSRFPVRESPPAPWAAVLGVVLTGMGNDGLSGATSIRRSPADAS